MTTEVQAADTSFAMSLVHGQIWVEPDGQIHDITPEGKSHGEWALDYLGQEQPTADASEEDTDELRWHAMEELFQMGWMRMGTFMRLGHPQTYLQVGGPLTKHHLDIAQRWLHAHQDWIGPEITLDARGAFKTMEMKDFLALNNPNDVRRFAKNAARDIYDGYCPICGAPGCGGKCVPPLCRRAAGPIPVPDHMENRVFDAIFNHIRDYWAASTGPVGVDRQTQIAIPTRGGTKVDGREIPFIYVTPRTVEGRYHTLQGAHMLDGRTPEIVVEFNGHMTGADILKALGDLPGLKLRGWIRHELAHCFDRIDGATGAEPWATPETYFNDPVEVRAYASQVYRHVMDMRDYYATGASWIKKSGEKALWEVVDSATSGMVGDKLRKYLTPANRRKLLQVVYRAIMECIEHPSERVASLKTAAEAGTLKADLMRIRPILRTWVGGGWEDGPQLVRLLEKNKDILAKFKPTTPLRLWRNERIEGPGGGPGSGSLNNHGWEDQYTRATAWSVNRREAETYAAGPGRRLVTAIVPPEDMYVSVPMVDHAARAMGWKTFDPLAQSEVIVKPNPSFLSQIRPPVKYTREQEAEVRNQLLEKLRTFYAPQIKKMQEAKPEGAQGIAARADEQIKGMVSAIDSEELPERVKEWEGKLQEWSKSAAAKTARPEQWGTPEFKAWFSGSKIVDAQGNPLPVYHGSVHGGIAHATVQTSWFTPSNEVATTYSRDESTLNGGPGRPSVQVFYLRITNPLVVDAQGERWMMIPFEGGIHTTDQLAQIAKKRGHDGLIVRNVIDNVNEEELEPSDIIATLGGRAQIKSAESNTGAFSPTDNNVTASFIVQASKTLYHGTTVERAKSIMRYGLTPSVGDLTATAYEEDDPNLEELTFAADRPDVRRSVLSAILHAISAEGHPINDRVTAIRNWGAVVVIREGEDIMEHRPDQDDPKAKHDYTDYPTQVEPGDYFSRDSVDVDDVITGPALVRWLQRNGAQLHGPTDTIPKRERDTLIGWVRQMHPNEPVQNIIEKVNGLPGGDFRKSWSYYQKLVQQKGKAASWEPPTFEQMQWSGTTPKLYAAAVARLKALRFPLTIYRAVKLPNEEALRTHEAGIFWTDQLDRAQFYTPAGRRAPGERFVLRAEVGPEVIDWRSTFEANCEKAGNTGTREQEIKLHMNAPVTINGILRPGETEFSPRQIRVTANTADKETERIRERAKTPEAKRPHKFQPAKWTHPNGHPRCKVCGDEEPEGGICKGAKTAAATPLDAAWVEQMRKDFLTLMRNLPKVQDYNTALQLQKAFHLFSNRINETIFDHFLNQSPDPKDKNSRVWIDGLVRKPAWEFYTELRLPIELSDAYWSPEMRFASFLRKVPAWEGRLRRKAQAFWAALRSAMEVGAMVANAPDMDTTELEGFQTIIKGYSPAYADTLEVIKTGLRLYRDQAARAFPPLLSLHLPIILDFTHNLDMGGEYRGGTVVIYVHNVAKSPQTLAQFLAHEMGHRLWDTLSGDAQRFWSSAIYQDYGDLDIAALLQKWPGDAWAFQLPRALPMEDKVLGLQVAALGHSPYTKGLETKEDFQKLLDSGTTTLSVPKTPITPYAHKNPNEAFCEAVGLLVSHGPRALDPQVLGWLTTIVPTSHRQAGITAATLTPQPNDIGLMTLDQFMQQQNPGETQHPSEAYNWTLEQMNNDNNGHWVGKDTYKGEIDCYRYPKGFVLRKDRVIVGVSDGHTLWLQHPMTEMPDTYHDRSPKGFTKLEFGDPVQVKYPAEHLGAITDTKVRISEKYPKVLQTLPEGYVLRSAGDKPNAGLALIHNDMIVGVAQDEWGATLISVAQEYRGHGVGNILRKYWGQMNPDYRSGGYTPAGRRMAIQAWSDRVRELLAHGVYSELLANGKMTREQVQAILKGIQGRSKGLSAPPATPDVQGKLQLYMDESAVQFVLYDDAFLQDQDPKHIKAYGFLRDGQPGTFFYRLDYDPAYREAATTIALQMGRNEGEPLYVGKGYGDLLEIGDQPVERKGDYVTLTKDMVDLLPLARRERAARKKVDRYGQIENLLLEGAEGKAWDEAA